MHQAPHDRSGPSSPTAPRVAAIQTVFPPYTYPQREILATLARTTALESEAGALVLRKIAQSSGVDTRSLSLPLEKLVDLARQENFTEQNRMWLDVALDLGERAITGALRAAGIRPQDVDAVISTTVTGLAVPSLEARLAHRVGLRPDVKRVPLFGSGCAGGAVGLARLHDYLLAHPGQVAVLLAVELSSLVFQFKDATIANVVAGSLFGDGAAAVVATGAHRDGAPAGPALVDTHSLLLPDTEDVLGWDIGSHGLRVLLAPEVPVLTEEHLPTAVHGLLDRHALTPDQIVSWIVHGGGPKVFTAVEQALDLPPRALELTRRSVAERGNLSSVSVLDILHAAMKTPPPPNAPGLVAAMGPGFAIELVLLSW
ncbi:type III polyketide synthase [Streptomyces venezuelae]|uniref:Type III polyketide synthase n=1 Tax=Streptomyces venezuelae TaxID=54571 RepID=A0A5P2BME5_STRVZ|nr:type III polyketide synthase [Streptomyces venezuelae]QES30878.1 type III polyketide synthase [Streptomyces venezuelae]